MKRSWLVQRLCPPRGQDNPFSFGGGLHNGGLSPDAMSLLRSIWSFDYMGAAEFEFGAVPQALRAIASTEHRKLRTRQITLRVPDDVAKPWDEKTPPDAHDRTIYLLGPEDFHDEAEHRIRGWAAGDSSRDFRTKEAVMLANVLRPGSYTPDVQGWLELDNGFLFFTDQQMFTKTCDLFAVPIPPES